MQNVHVVARPEFHALSNGSLIFSVSLILCTGKWMKLFIHHNCACIQPQFSAYWTQLTENQSASFEKAEKLWFRSSITVLHILCMLVCLLPLKDIGIRT
jgi:hypothetical protein